MSGEADKGDEVRENALAACTFDLGLLQGRIGLPELGFVPKIGRLFDGIGEVLDVLELQPLFVRLTVEDLQSGDLVFVLCDEQFERLYDGAGTSQRVGAEACFDDLILADMVDGQLIFLLDVDEQFAELRVLKWLGGFLDERAAAFAICCSVGLSVPNCFLANSSCRSGLTASTN